MIDEAWMANHLKELRAEGLHRALNSYRTLGPVLQVGEEKLLNFASNDYLNLAQRQEQRSQSAETTNELGTGSGASRLVSGTLVEHEKLELEAADFFKSSALVFGSGYLANLGLVATISGRNSVVLADKLSHATLIDAAVLARAELKRFHHNDVEHLERLLKKACDGSADKRVLVVTESVFSMDGDLAPLREMAKLCELYGAGMVVDEAHAVGVFGESGRGLVEAYGLADEVQARTATFSKSGGSYGGLVIGSEVLKEYLVNKARTFIYDTSLPPGVIAANRGALKTMVLEPSLGLELLRNAAFFREQLAKRGIDTGKSASQIVPVVIGESEKTLKVSNELKSRGILAVGIRSPTVPTGTARLRFSLTLAHTESELERTAIELENVLKKEEVL
jgi:8-amino-7-oxononanoate synthase